MKKTTGKCSAFLVIIGVLLLYPLWSFKCDGNFELSGTAVVTEVPQLSALKFLDGSYQEGVDNWLAGNIPGRNFLIRLRGQIIYSLFRTSPDEHITLGENGQLFEPEYLLKTLDIVQPKGSDYTDELTDKLEQLQTELAASGQELYVFITPSKARYFSADAPLAFKVLAGNTAQPSNYDRFINSLQNSDVNYYDSIAYIDQIKDSFPYPLYYSTGIHWSNVLGATVAQDFNRYLQEKSAFSLGLIHVDYAEAETPTHPDMDLYKTLNLLSKPNVQYYVPLVTPADNDDAPSVFFRGGSFMGQSMAVLAKNGVFSDTVHFENNYYFTNDYQNQTVLSAFNAYDEFTDLRSYLAKSNIVILEVNENAIDTMSWGFIDYILDNHLLQGAPEMVMPEGAILEHLADATLTGKQIVSTDIDPWGTTIGKIADENGKQALFMMPNTGISMVYNPASQSKLTFEYGLYPAVRSVSDGCILSVQIRKPDGTADVWEIPVPADSDYLTDSLDLSAYAGQKIEIKLTCANAKENNENGDWLIIKNAMLS